MSKIVECLYWDGHQLTLYLEDRNILIEKLTPVMQALHDQYAVQGWNGLLDGEALAEYVVSEVELVTDGSRWLGFNVVRPWFLTEEVVTEEFIGGFNTAEAVAILKVVAKVAEATRILVGTRAAPDGKHRGLSKLYQNLGLKVSTIELTLETP
ncbi:hypothetical protein [Providencia phage PSTNGR1]|uniref:Uncharacterized protein n=1 Tax=Providencia phage PSTNGR1 TaxID=2783542 RepID=A0A873WRD2_9CAUD|nr:hypothetical protein [Providencia phage PSTNGR1]